MVVVACVVIGAVAGVSIPGKSVTSGSGKVFFKASHTLIAESSASTDVSATAPAVSLQQAAFLVNTGDVPTRTAEKLGLPPVAVNQSVQGIARGDVNALEVTAYSADGDLAVRLADTSAAQLLQYIGETATTEYNKQRDTLLARLDVLSKERDKLTGELSTAGTGTTSSPELESVINQYRITYEQFQQLAARGQPTVGLRTIEAAEKVVINEEDYNTAKASILAGPAIGLSATEAKKAATPSEPPKAPVRGAAGSLLGLLLGVTIVLITDRFDTRVRRREVVEVATGLPVLSEIPPLDRREQSETHIMTASEPRSSTAEAYRVVRTTLGFARAADQSRGERADDALGEVIMVTSANPGEGKTTSAANLAAVFAEGGDSVLVIDCDFRRPRIHKYLTAPDSATEKVLHAADRELGVNDTGRGLRASETGIPGVRLVHGIGEVFPDLNPIEIVAYQRKVIAVARQHFDIVLLDTAPFLTTNDASELLNDTDVVFLVVRAGKTTFASAQRAAELLKRLEAPVLGVILTSSSDSSAAQYYYHYYLEQEGPRRRRPGASGPKATKDKNSTDRAAVGNGGDPGAAPVEANGGTGVDWHGGGNGNGQSNGRPVSDDPART